MNNELKVGRLVRDPNEGRDAIHIAIVPVVAGRDVEPGQHVGLVSVMDDRIIISPAALKKIGVIDPFLTKTVKGGEQCYLFIYPNQVTSLTHHWTHPAFGDKGPTEPVKFVPEGLVKEVKDA